MSDEDNPYRFAAVEVERESDVAPAVSPFRQPETGRKLSANDVRIVAFSQRGLWICAVPMALWMCVWVVTTVLSIEAFYVFARLPDELHFVFGAFLTVIGGIVLFAWLGGLIFVLAIASRTHSTWLSFVIWFFAMYPPIMLLMLPYLQSRAAQALRRHGIPAGLFGADMKALPPADLARPTSTSKS